MRANEICDPIDSADLATVTGGRFFGGWFSKPAPALGTKPAPALGTSPNLPVGKAVTPKIHKHSSSSNAEVLRPTGWGEGMYGWSQ